MAHEYREALEARGIPTALSTGEERIVVPGGRHTAATVEMCPFRTPAEVAVIDEAQMPADPERGPAWTAAIMGVPARTVIVLGARRLACRREDRQAAPPGRGGVGMAVGIFEVQVMSTLAVLGVMREVGAACEAQSATRATIAFDPTAALLQRIEAGARGDIAILTAEGIARLAAAGVLDPASRTDLCRSLVGMAVRRGAPKPDIATEAALRRTLHATRSIVYSRAGASGLYFAALVERLGLAAAVGAKATVIPSGLTAERVARGEAELAVQQISELMAVEGIDIVGPLPMALQQPAVFSAALFAGARPAAARLLHAIAGACTPEVLARNGLEPPPPRA